MYSNIGVPSAPRPDLKLSSMIQEQPQLFSNVAGGGGGGGGQDGGAGAGGEGKGDDGSGEFGLQVRHTHHISYYRLPIPCNEHVFSGCTCINIGVYLFIVQRPLLVILDRNVDLTSAVHHTATYQVRDSSFTHYLPVVKMIFR